MGSLLLNFMHRSRRQRFAALCLDSSAHRSIDPNDIERFDDGGNVGAMMGRATNRFTPARESKYEKQTFTLRKKNPSEAGNNAPKKCPFLINRTGRLRRRLPIQHLQQLPSACWS